MIESKNCIPCSTPECEKDFFDFVAMDFREEQSRKSLASNELEIESTLTDWELRETYGGQHYKY